MALLVRQSTPDDIDEIQRVYQAVGKQGGGIGRAEDELPRDLIASFLADSHSGRPFSLVVVRRRAPAVVLGELHWRWPRHRAIAHLFTDITIAVDPAEQGGGLGFRLFDALLEHAAARGVSRIELMCRESNARALALYARFGFVVEGRLRARIVSVAGPLEDDLFLACHPPLLAPARHLVILTSRGLDPSIPTESSQIAQAWREAHPSLRVSLRHWDEPAAAWEDDDVDLVYPAEAWDYISRMHEFRAFLDMLAARGVAVANPSDVLLWNADKSIYLPALEAAGAPVIPTRWARDSDVSSDFLAEAWLRTALEALGVGTTGVFVIKPSISNGAFLTRKFDAVSEFADAVGFLRKVVTSPGNSAAMVQPFVSSVAEAGELSFIFLGGHVSHVVRKVPKPGDFRVQEQFGSTRHPVPLDECAAFLPIAERIVRLAQTATQRSLAYARVDCMLSDDVAGERLRLVELELFEPSLFLAHAASSSSALELLLRALLRVGGFRLAD